MGRPRAYDTGEVLKAAMAVFWQKGYAATSMSDIYAATGLKPGNLYAAFTDKETLFARAFAAYAEDFRATLPTDVEGRAAIEAWVAVQARLATGDPDRKGCLIINTIAEREVHSPANRALAAARLEEIGAFFRRHLAIAQARGELAAGADLAVQEAALTGAVVAIMTLARGGVPVAMIEGVAAQALAGLRAA
jgi:TetR/AcrR family transcriptional repressor of nem operon